MMDDLTKISLTVYVSNIPSHLMVSNSETLIDSLANIWIGKLRLHANVARFKRKENGKPPVKANKHVPQFIKKVSNSSNCNNASSYANVAKASTSNGGLSTKVNLVDKGENSPVITLKQDPSSDFPLAILGCYHDFRSIANTHIMCRNKGFLDLDFKYLGGLWVLFKFNSLEARDKFLKHKGVLKWFSSLKPCHDDFMVDERLIWLEIEGDVTYAIRVRELCSWTPSFAADDSDTDDEGSMETHDLEKENNFMGSIVKSALNLDDMVNDHVNKTNDQEHRPNIQEQVINTVESQGVACTHEKPLCSDPFGLGPLIDKKCGKEDVANCFVTPEYPPVYSPNSKRDKHSSDYSHHLSEDNSYKQAGFSLIQRLEETIKVGTALGLNMKGCENTLVNGWVDGSGSNPGGGFGKPRGGHETRDGDGLEGPVVEWRLGLNVEWSVKTTLEEVKDERVRVHIDYGCSSLKMWVDIVHGDAISKVVFEKCEEGYEESMVFENPRKDGASFSSDDEGEEEVTEGEEIFFPFSLLGFLKMSRGSMTCSWNVNLADGTMA
ncbi:hypothetical protein Tco_0286847 [Tanacetum coccineum]